MFKSSFSRKNAIIVLGLAGLSFAHAASARDISIVGAPRTAVAVGGKYSFTPATTGDSGRRMTFTIVNKPYWATFSKYNGTLSGTPAARDAKLYSKIIISVTDGKTRDTLPAFALNVTGTGSNASANTAPTISGTPAKQVEANKAYSFVPAAADANKDSLTFSISSKPSWATFDAKTGKLYGVPTAQQIGSYEEIQISVNDGKATTKLPMFAIEVMQGAPEMRTVTVSWNPPTVNTDGTTLTNLAGYRILYGTVSGQYTKTVSIANAGLANYVLENLPAGHYYVVMVAVNSNGDLSEKSSEVSVEL